MTRALIFAGNSFVGRHFIRRLTQAQVEVVATARAARSGFLSCDLTIPRHVENVIASTRPDWIIQCAAATTTVSRLEMDRLHLGGARNVLDAVARHVPASVVLFFGSAAEYGNVEAAALPIAESQMARPGSFFGQSKLAQLRLAQQMAAEFGLRILTLRPFNLLGPGLPDHYLPAALVRRLRDNRAANRFGPFHVSNHQATRDWVDVRDLAEAVIALLGDRPPAPAAVDLYNVASGKETSVLDLAKKLCEIAGGFTAVAADNEPSRSGIHRSCGDARKLFEAIGWKPRVSWEQSLADLWADVNLVCRAA